MSPRKRSGLQHTLGEILRERQSPILEEKSQYTAELLSQVAPTGDQQTPVTETPVTSSHQVPTSHQSTKAYQAPVPISHQYTELKEHFTKIPNASFDKLIASLDPYEFKVYFRLYRLSHGFHQNHCFLGYASLSKGCSLSNRHLKRIIPKLVSRGLVKVLKVYNEGKNKGTLYEISTGDQQSPVTHRHRGPAVTGDQQSPNKEDDDLKDISHHQRETMTIYQELTHNKWKKADNRAYQKIKDVPIEKIEAAIHSASQRAASRPNSLSYFIKEISNLAQPSAQSRTQRKKTLEKIIQQVEQTHLGQQQYSFSEFREDVKLECGRTGKPFDSDLFNEIIGPP